ncbi:MAG: (Fe-S)-binding protein [Desulfarculus sp.]|nr:(Fe-S)-binding protein [Desulfarculus sp.]
MILDNPRVKEIIARRHLHMCLECGKCSASCPRYISGKQYSPRMLAHKLIAEPQDRAYIENSVWDCLTCGQCQERCPSGVEFVQLILDMRRELAASQGLMGYRAHDGALHSWMRIMTSPDLKQNRTQWLSPELKTRTRGETAYFVGCAPYFDVFFAGLGVRTLDIAKDSVRLLNRLGVEPVVLEQERCCGHDLLWSGDQDNFTELCRLNYQEFKAAGVREIVVSCPECHSVLSQYLPQVVQGCDLKVTLLIDLARRAAEQGLLDFTPLEGVVTYQDPCRLGRQAGCLEAPRELLGRIPGLELKEMANHGLGALCCGNNSFINCDAYSKRHQVERLRQGLATGAGLLVTACPKCMIHLTCAMRDPHQDGPLQMKVRDLASLLADHIR